MRHFEFYVPWPWSSLVEGKLLFLLTNSRNYAVSAWQNSTHVWLLGRSSCSSPYTKELHGEALPTSLEEEYRFKCDTKLLRHYNFVHLEHLWPYRNLANLAERTHNSISRSKGEHQFCAGNLFLPRTSRKHRTLQAEPSVVPHHRC